MCSVACPCATTYSNTWSKLDEITLNKFKRTGVTGTTPTDAKGNYRFNWVNKATSPSVTTYETFDACHVYIMSNPAA